MRDPRCPACGGKVSATAGYCLHCGEEFEAPVEGSGTDGVTLTVERDTDRTDSELGLRGRALSRVWIDAGAGSETAAGTGATRGTVGRPGESSETSIDPLSAISGALSFLLTPVTTLLDRSRWLSLAVAAAAASGAALTVYRSLPDVRNGPGAVAVVVGVALFLHVGGQIRGEQVLATSGIAAGTVLLVVRAGEALGRGLAGGLPELTRTLSTATQSIALGTALLAVGLLLRD